MPGPHRDHLHRDVDAPASRPRGPGGRSRPAAWRPAAPGPARVGGAEHGPEVAEAGRGQQGVARGVGGDVAVGVPGQADRLVREVQAGHVARHPVGEGVDVHAGAHPQVGPGRLGRFAHGPIQPRPGARVCVASDSCTLPLGPPRRAGTAARPSVVRSCCWPAAAAPGWGTPRTRCCCRSPAAPCWPGRWSGPAGCRGWCAPSWSCAPRTSTRSVACSRRRWASTVRWRSCPASRRGTARSGTRSGTWGRTSVPVTWTSWWSTTQPGRWRDGGSSTRSR